MSESNAYDQIRKPAHEWIKRRIVASCAAGFAGGSDARDYLIELGMPADRIAIGYDIVDNDHFAQGSARARANAAALRERFALPRRFFLCCCRFVAKKNLPFLIDAFASYRAAGGDCDLVLAGDGEEAGALAGHARSLGIATAVHFPGFVQYDELPVYYGLASAFVLPSMVEQWGLVVNEAMASGLPVIVSRRCGSARDLVTEGVNGHLFDPADRMALVDALASVAREGASAAMGAASRRSIAGWGGELFADGLERACRIARDGCRRRPGLIDRAVLAAAAR